MKRVRMVLCEGNVLFPYRERCEICGRRVSAFRRCVCVEAYENV